MGKGLVTPFVEVRLKGGENESERYSAGVTYTTPGGFDAELVGKHNSAAGGTTNVDANFTFDF